MKINQFRMMKQAGEKISIITCYDYWSAKIIASSGIDCILVGDSLTMVMHGHENPIPATVELMALHVEAVARGAGKKFIIVDMPFLAHRKGLNLAMDSVQQLIQAGAHAIKIEGVLGNEEIIHHIVESGIPVMGHLGLTAQSIHQLGGFRVQGKEKNAAESLLQHAKLCEEVGCFAVVLECIPSDLAAAITEQISIPTIGIGAGPQVDGQVLVLQDLLGMDAEFKPKFLKQYLNGFELIQAALNNYNQEVKARSFPTQEHCY